MNKDRIIALLKDKLEFFSRQVQFLLGEVQQLKAQLEEKDKSIRSLEEALTQKDQDIETLSNKNRGLGKLLSHPSEKITPPKKETLSPEKDIPPPEKSTLPEEIAPTDESSPQEEIPPVEPAKKRGNNNAKRKEHLNLETVIEDIYPSDEGFDKDKASCLGVTESIRYDYIPARFVKRIYRLHAYKLGGKIFCPDTKLVPRAPFMNSNYSASFIAVLIQLRFIYSMPIERIVKLFNESGFELDKATAHGLIKKAAEMLAVLEPVLHQAILEDGYLNMDESYYTILTDEKNEKGKKVRKGYLWAALASRSKLIQFFYDNGSRAQKVLLDYIGATYKGAIQTDGYGCYKILQTDAYPNIIQLSCFQHVKRKFLDIVEDADAKEVVDIICKLYHHEHLIPKDFTLEQRHNYRQEYAPPILDELKKKLLEIQAQALPPKSPLAQATTYALNEYPALCNYIIKPEYKLDNNAIEQKIRYISLSRRNSLFCGSHKGAERMSLLYSLACSCRLNNLNTVEYFTDLFNTIPYLPPYPSSSSPPAVYRDILPDRWKKKKDNSS